ncbi:CLUMA_CG021501, isoform A [Clunio marinus]|uniref:CLUMA_CG021501, isoform A n=1 Tax=Clunio marinus TaxID=568069 RepID=A0A1J1J815_9DIPT|nr:CLUMA_CG021501, isoform A [Clunio marinus]
MVTAGENMRGWLSGSFGFSYPQFAAQPHKTPLQSTKTMNFTSLFRIDGFALPLKELYRLTQPQSKPFNKPNKSSRVFRYTLIH